MPETSPSQPENHSGDADGRTWGDVEEHRLHARVMARLFGEPAAPTAIGRFRVERQLGEGAMGVVYAAVDDQLGRRVALKLLHPHLAHDDLGRARLLREARAMARLEHENIARIYEASAWNDQVYLAMELIDGVTLDVWLRQRARPWREILAIFLQAGRALSAAHRAGFLHRDFKPENILVDTRDRARVLDFGLARAVEGAREDLGDDLLAPLTRTGSILGTPAYMAPEQLRSGEAEARSDQFSFCVALFEGLFGIRPFDHVPRFGPLTIATPPRGRVPGRLRRALVRGLAEAPGDRWPDMDALLAALAGPPRARLAGIAVGAAGGALVAGLVAAWLLRAQQAALDDVARSQTATDAQLAALRGDLAIHSGEQRAADEQHARVIRAHDAAVDRLPHDPTTALLLLREVGADGPLVARALAEPISAAVLAGHAGPVRSIRFLETDVETVDAAGEVRRFPADGRGRPTAGGRAAPPDPRRSPDGALTLRELGGKLLLARRGAAPRPLAGVTGPPGQVAWSPDAARVAVAVPGGAVWLAEKTGGRPRPLARRGAPVRALAWAPDGRRLAIGRDDGAIEVWQRSSRTWRRVAASLGLTGAATALAFAADGRWLAGGGDDGVIRVWRLDAQAPPRELRGHTGGVQALAFDPTGVRVASGGDDGTARVWHLWPRALAIHALAGPLNSLAWHPDGETLAAAGDRGVGVWLLPAAGGAGRPLAHPGTVFAVAWSPEGRTLATADAAGVVRRWPRDGDAPDRAEPARSAPLLALAWSADGRLAGGGLDEAITIWPAGQDAPRRLASPRGSVEALAWSGDRLAFVTDGGALVITGADGRPALERDLGESEALGDLAWSPAGDALAIVGDRRALLRVAADDGRPTVLGRHPTAVWSVAWDPQGRVVVTGGGDGSLYVWPAQGGGPAEVLPAHGDSVHALAFDPRGDRLASAGADGRVIVWARSDADLQARVGAATSACLSPAQRQTLLGEPADAATARAAACESAAGR